MSKTIKYIAIYEVVKLVGKTALMTYAQTVREKDEFEGNLGTYLLSALAGYHIGTAYRFSPLPAGRFP